MSDSVEEAQRLYKDSLDALSDQRRQIEEDLQFTDPSDPQQWDDDIKRTRTTDPGGARPCLVFDQCSQYENNVAGQVEQRPPSIHTVPATNGDKRVAEKLDGIFRNVEYASRAQQHYVRALRGAARVGAGYLTLRPEFIDRAMGYQEPRIGSVGDPMSVVLDAWSVELDGSDAMHGTILTPYSHREWDRKFGKKEKVNFADADRNVVKDDRESVIVGEQWRVEDRTKNMIVCLDPRTQEEVALPEDDYWKNAQRDGVTWKVVRNYSDKKRVVLWSLMSGCDELTKTVEYPADGIGIVPVYGYVGWSDGRMKYCGIGRRARSAQQDFNFHMSELHAYMAQAPKMPWWVPLESVPDANVQKIYDRLGVDSRAWAPYRALDEEGRQLPPPQRAQVSIDLRNHEAGVLRAERNIQASIGMYQASLGAPSNESSGVAIDSRKQQGEASTAHFPAHLQAAVSQIGRLAIDMIVRVIDTKRQARILGEDKKASNVIIDPEQREAARDTDKGLSINPGVGKYDAYCVVGASYSTQRAQAAAGFEAMIRSNPQLAPVLSYFWALNLDIQGGDKMAQALAAMLPAPVQAIINPDSQHQPDPAAMAAKVEELTQALKEAIQHAHDAQADADEANGKLEQAEDKNSIAAYEAETKRMVGLKDAIDPAQIQQLVVQTLETMMRSPEPMPGDPEPGPDAWQQQQMPADMPQEQPQGMPPEQSMPGMAPEGMTQ